jgi:hypothetical protein
VVVDIDTHHRRWYRLLFGHSQNRA